MSLDVFLSKLDEIRHGPLHELQGLHREAQALHNLALHATNAATEQDAIHRAESCAEKASAAAKRTCEALQELKTAASAPANPTEANLRRQSFTGVSVLFQNALNSYFQAQQVFRTEMEAKVSRQLRAAFPEADPAEVAAVVAGRGSAASTIQDTLRNQPDMISLGTITSLRATKEQCDELETLATAARELRQAFLDVSVLVNAQGEVIDDIAAHLMATRDQTRATRDVLENTVARQRTCRMRWCIAVTLAILILALVVALLIQKH